jgi:hypothetical protein
MVASVEASPSAHPSCIFHRGRRSSASVKNRSVVCEREPDDAERASLSLGGQLAIFRPGPMPLRQPPNIGQSALETLQIPVLKTIVKTRRWPSSRRRSRRPRRCERAGWRSRGERGADRCSGRRSPPGRRQSPYRPAAARLR